MSNFNLFTKNIILNYFWENIPLVTCPSKKCCLVSADLGNVGQIRNALPEHHKQCSVSSPRPPYIFVLLIVCFACLFVCLHQRRFFGQCLSLTWFANVSNFPSRKNFICFPIKQRCDDWRKNFIIYVCPKNIKQSMLKIEGDKRNQKDAS